MDISIVIVNYNSEVFLKNCIDSIMKNLIVDFELIIVDNASKIETIKMLNEIERENAKCTFIYSEKNLGFARANNLGAEIAKGEFIHFLNPDILIEKDINDVYINIIQERKRALYATTLYDNNIESKTGYLIPTIKNYIKNFFLKNVDRWYIGASIIVEKNIFDEIGGWPEDYFMYAEDLDLCYRAMLLNIDIYKVEAFIQHVGGGSTKTVWNRFDTDVKKEIANIKFFKKYNLQFDYFFSKMIVLLLNYKNPASIVYICKVIKKAISTEGFF